MKCDRLVVLAQCVVNRAQIRQRGCFPGAIAQLLHNFQTLLMEGERLLVIAQRLMSRAQIVVRRALPSQILKFLLDCQTLLVEFNGATILS